MWFRFAWLVALLCVPARHASSQTRAETIRGQVKTDSGKAMAAADIIVTMAPNREIFRAASDSAGNYQLRIEKAPVTTSCTSGHPAVGRSESE
jgi:hypothetical protein